MSTFGFFPRSHGPSSYYNHNNSNTKLDLDTLKNSINNTINRLWDEIYYKTNNTSLYKNKLYEYKKQLNDLKLNLQQQCNNYQHTYSPFDFLDQNNYYSAIDDIKKINKLIQNIDDNITNCSDIEASRKQFSTKSEEDTEPVEPELVESEYEEDESYYEDTDIESEDNENEESEETEENTHHESDENDENDENEENSYHENEENDESDENIIDDEENTKEASVDENNDELKDDKDKSEDKEDENEYEADENDEEDDFNIDDEYHMVEKPVTDDEKDAIEEKIAKVEEQASKESINQDITIEDDDLDPKELKNKQKIEKLDPKIQQAMKLSETFKDRSEKILADLTQLKKDFYAVDSDLMDVIIDFDNISTKNKKIKLLRKEKTKLIDNKFTEIDNIFRPLNEFDLTLKSRA